ncbi:MAG: hypothetical protein LW854_08650 [Rubrivivax sp.]|nr:hypothetical protein [Rubrivivax sp.]
MILIAFRHSDTRPFARVVTLLRGGDSAHCEVAIPVQGVHLCVSASWLDGGVRGKVIDISSADKWRVYRWTGPHIDPIDWLKSNKKARYDRRGLLGILLPPVGHNPGKKFCSEAAAEMLMLPYPATYDLGQLERFVMASEHAERLQ